MHVQDLKLEADVLPFFNYTNSKQSEEQLLALLENVPATETEVAERQAITKGLIANWTILENFTYRKLDLREVYLFCNEIADKGLTIDRNKLKSSLKLRFSAAERNRQRSKLVQAVLLLNDIHGQYLGRIHTSYFPEAFRLLLQHALRFLAKLKLDKTTELINQDRFTVSEIIKYTTLLSELDPRDIRAFWQFFFNFEAYWSLAKGTLKHSFTFPVLGDDELSIEEFYHPMVKQPVKNTLVLGANNNVLLLTGPNMSGKSTLLKAVGLCVYLARAGFTVPASSCTIPFFHTIAIAINLNDNLRNGYSHFMAELENLKNVVTSTADGKRCFAIFDEIFKGTNIDDALDITQVTIDGLANIEGSCFLISTHLLQLEKQLISSSESIKKCFIECVLDNGTPEFSYKLKDGWSQLKIGRILFEKEGLTGLLSK